MSGGAGRSDYLRGHRNPDQLFRHSSPLNFYQGISRFNVSVLDNPLLNPQQREAVDTIEGPLLIIAGAGSGKTRTVTCRIARMLELGIPPEAVLALTFTNKAAREMAERVASLIGKTSRGLTVSTFHAFGVRLLRDHIPLAGWKENFSIYDQGDKISLIKEASRNLRAGSENTDLYRIASLFSAVKTGRGRFEGSDMPLKGLYEEYQALLKVYNAVDFDDLIVLPEMILSAHSRALEKVRDTYRYIMVDEFQDTSAAQYRLLHLLGSEHRNVCVVGDDDQSIYSWRGADYHNILAFEKDFPEVKEIKLEQNYRSTGTILTAANNLIAHNKNRKSKELWTGSDGGTHIELFSPENEYEEARYIARIIRELSLRERKTYHDFGVLVRANSLTAVIEEVFLDEGIPYRVSGGMSFFQRGEVKDIIAYLRLLLNGDDDINFLRIINTPRRGIGRTTLTRIREESDLKKQSLYSSAQALVHAADTPLDGRAIKNLKEFLDLLDDFSLRIRERNKLSETVRLLVDRVEFWGFLLQEHPKNTQVAKWKYDNIQRFIGMIDAWERDPDNRRKDPWAFLNRITLTTQEEDGQGEQGKVGLMTIHAAKGLEFDTVFLPALEKGILPHRRSLEENESNLEEERRLFYVAITRAMNRLFITWCRKRRVMREEIEAEVSPFLEELPKDLVMYHTPETAAKPEEVAALFEAFRAARK
ncbi:MAG: UvrD-helicase domain-containing protein [Spirochaetales bacterium]|nr:UvrD-helicase domain-containing protein [Spirochaetales bacterium]